MHDILNQWDLWSITTFNIRPILPPYFPLSIFCISFAVVMHETRFGILNTKQPLLTLLFLCVFISFIVCIVKVNLSMMNVMLPHPTSLCLQKGLKWLTFSCPFLRSTWDFSSKTRLIHWTGWHLLSLWHGQYGLLWLSSWLFCRCFCQFLRLKANYY